MSKREYPQMADAVFAVLMGKADALGINRCELPWIEEGEVSYLVYLVQFRGMTQQDVKAWYKKTLNKGCKAPRLEILRRLCQIEKAYMADKKATFKSVLKEDLW